MKAVREGTAEADRMRNKMNATSRRNKRSVGTRMKGCCTEGGWDLADTVEADSDLSSSSECETLCNSALVGSGGLTDKFVSSLQWDWRLASWAGDLGCFLSCATVTAVTIRAASDTANTPTSIRKLRNTSVNGGPEYNVWFPLPNLQM